LAALSALLAALFFCRHCQCAPRQSLDSIEPERGSNNALVQYPSPRLNIPLIIPGQPFSTYGKGQFRENLPPRAAKGISSTHRGSQRTSPFPQNDPLQYQNQYVYPMLPASQIVISAAAREELGHILRTSGAVVESAPKAGSRTSRQQESERQMRVISEEIEPYRDEAEPVPFVNSGDSQQAMPVRETEMVQLKHQIQMMSQQIAFFKARQTSARAQSLSDGAPPSYSLSETGAP